MLRALLLLLALGGATRAAEVPVFDPAGPGGIVRDETSRQMRCTTDPEVRFGDFWDARLRAHRPARLAIGPTGWSMFVVDSQGLYVWEGAACDAASAGLLGRPAEALRVPLAPDVAQTLDRWAWTVHPRLADGSIVFRDATHLVRVSLDPPGVAPIGALADLAALAGPRPGTVRDAEDIGTPVVTPDGELWMILEGRKALGSSSAPRFRGVAALPADGSAPPRLLFGNAVEANPTPQTVDEQVAVGDPLYGANALAWDPVHGWAIAGGGPRRLVVIPPGATAPLPVDLALFGEGTRVVPSEDAPPLWGGAWPDVADLDGDGLSGPEEDAAATSPIRADTDGDGVRDGVEVGWFATSPTDPASRPAAPVIGDLAPSTLLSDWAALARPGAEDRPIERYYVRDVQAAPGVLCAGPTCWDARGAVLTASLPVPVVGGSPPPDAPRRVWIARSGDGYVVRREDGGLRVFDFEGAREWTPVDDAWSRALRTPEVTAESLDALYVRDDDAVWRIAGFAAGPVEPFPLIDNDRWGCPLAIDPAALAACPSNAAFEGDRASVVFGGVDDTVGAPVVLIQQGNDAWVEALFGERRVRLLGPADLGHRTGYGQLAYGAGPDAAAISLTRIAGGAGFRSRLLFDAARTPSDAPIVGGTDFEAGPWFDRGFFVRVTLSYPHLSGPGAGTETFDCIGGYCFTFPSNPQTVTTYLHMLLASLWIPRAPDPRRGEVILAARSVRLLGNGGIEEPADDGLWRLGPDGEAGPWMTRDRLAALAGEAPFGQTEASSIGNLAASPDGTRLCFVTSRESGLWELALEETPEGFTPRSLTRLDVAAPVACAYGPEGRLAVLAASPSRIAFPGGGADIALDLEKPLALAARGDALYAMGAGQTARCVRGGAVNDVGLRATAIAAGPAGQALVIDAFGRGTLHAPDALCGGEAPVEILDPAGSLWARVTDLDDNDFAPKGKRALPHGAAAVATEAGYVYLTGLAGAFVPEGSDPQVAVGDTWSATYGRLLRVRPAYAAADCDARLTALDPVRRAATRVTFAAPHAQVAAMAVLGQPLAAAGEDWEYRGLERPVVDPCAIVPQTPDAGVPDADAAAGAHADAGPAAEDDPSAAEDGGCGCAATGAGAGPLPWLVLGLLAVTRRHRRMPTPSSAHATATAGSARIASASAQRERGRLPAGDGAGASSGFCAGAGAAFGGCCSRKARTRSRARRSAGSSPSSSASRSASAAFSSSR